MRAGDVTTMRSATCSAGLSHLHPEVFVPALVACPARNFNQLRREASVAHEPKPLILNPDH